MMRKEGFRAGFCELEISRMVPILLKLAQDLYRLPAPYLAVTGVFDSLLSKQAKHPPQKKKETTSQTLEAMEPSQRDLDSLLLSGSTRLIQADGSEDSGVQKQYHPAGNSPEGNHPFMKAHDEFDNILDHRSKRIPSDKLALELWRSLLVSVASCRGSRHIFLKGMEYVNFVKEVYSHRRRETQDYIAPPIGRVYRDKTVNATHLVESYYVGWVIEDKNLILEDLSRIIVVYLEKKGVPNTMIKHASTNTVPSVEFFPWYPGLEKWVKLRLEIMGQDPMSLPLHGDLNWSILQRSKIPCSVRKVAAISIPSTLERDRTS
ncbi:MAG: hypothetical protein J3Q66DRAFT_393112 [Benniella sp.]|nr:MAG: hypothetical protein J3Q66DRAFT_393112 [Benniella sp.]